MKRMMDGSKVFSIKEIADGAGLTYSLVWTRVSRGLLPSPTVPRGRSLYYTESDYHAITAHLIEDCGEKVAK